MSDVADDVVRLYGPAIAVSFIGLPLSTLERLRADAIQRQADPAESEYRGRRAYVETMVARGRLDVVEAAKRKWGPTLRRRLPSDDARSTRSLRRDRANAGKGGPNGRPVKHPDRRAYMREYMRERRRVASVASQASPGATSSA